MKTLARPYTRSSSFKMAALFTLLLGFSAMLLGYFLYDFGRQNFIRETQAAIDYELEQLIVLMQPMTQPQQIEYIAHKAATHKHPLYWFESKEARRLAGNIDAPPKDVKRIAEGVIGFEAVIAPEKKSVAGKIHTFEDGSRLLVARDVEAVTKSHERLQWISFLIIAFMLIVITVSFLISLFVVRRINQIAETARDIMETGDLSRRIRVQGNWDDLSNLAQILNHLLAQVERLMHGIKDVSSSIAHDLRTPLSRLRQQLEALHAQSPQPEQTAELLAEADHLLAIFQALLRIASIEKSQRTEHFTTVDLTQLVRDVLELYEPLAEEKNIRLETDIAAEAPIRGDRDLLFQALANLLDNAIKFSGANSRIHLSLQRQGARYELCIADAGCGIAPEERDKVFERFYRAEKSRSTQGSGLGLSLVKAIIDLHGGAIVLRDNQPGLRVRLTL